MGQGVKQLRLAGGGLISEKSSLKTFPFLQLLKIKGL
jgi:hypothetical protein